MKLLARLLADRNAAAATELALVLPGIAFIVLNVSDVGVYMFTRMQVDLAAQAAVAAARETCNTDTKLASKANCTGLDTAMTAGAQSTSLGSTVQLTPSSAADWDYYCSDTTGKLVLAKTNNVVWTNCTQAGSGTTTVPGLYIKATTSRAYAPIFPGMSVASALTTPIIRVAWMRLK